MVVWCSVCISGTRMAELLFLCHQVSCCWAHQVSSHSFTEIWLASSIEILPSLSHSQTNPLGTCFSQILHFSSNTCHVPLTILHTFFSPILDLQWKQGPAVAVPHPPPPSKLFFFLMSKRSPKNELSGKILQQKVSLLLWDFFPHRDSLCKLLILRHMLKPAHPPHSNSENVQPAKWTILFHISAIQWNEMEKRLN